MKQQQRMSKTIRSLRKGQITIPAAFRERLGIEEDSLLQLTVVGDELRIKKLAVREAGQGSPWLKELYDYFAPVREEAIERGYSEEEINAAIDEALAEVRRRTPGP
jgi:AbrB family looped-hinge helix DNA binding protein